MKIVGTNNLLFADEAFRTIGQTELLPDKALTRAHLKDAEMLCSRSTIRINKDLLENTTVKFVGTATIGIDHMDTGYMDSAGIKWCSAPGCNANSVAEYVVSALLCLATRHNFKITGKTIGVIGVGNVGSKVVEKAEALGMRVLQNDPPRAEAEHDTCFVSLDDLLAASDIVTMHVPLSKTGRHTTRHMVDKSFFQKLKPGCIFINAARGGIMITDALIEAVKNEKVAHTVLDTWENEPEIRSDILQVSDLATPHIAGHSFEGKAIGTEMIYNEACRFIGVQPAWSCKTNLEQHAAPSVCIDGAGKTFEQTLWETVKQVYDITGDDKKLREIQGKDAVAVSSHFRNMRQNYPIRREFRFVKVKSERCNASAQKAMAALGFKLNP